MRNHKIEQMALIAMAVYDTEENKRSWMTNHVIEHFAYGSALTNGHRLFIIDNASCIETKLRIKAFEEGQRKAGKDVTVITNEKNIGTAEAINLAWRHRRPGEHCVKMDNDVAFLRHSIAWVDQLEEAIARDPEIGIVGLKRKDCIEHPENPDPFYRSELYHLPHKPGERWIVAEKVHHVMGTCQMYSSALLDKIGYLRQPRLYGFDDVLASARSSAAGFKNVFLPHIEIDHIDPGATPYQQWKEQQAREDWNEALSMRDAIMKGEHSYYYNPFEQ